MKKSTVIEKILETKSEIKRLKGLLKKDDEEIETLKNQYQERIKAVEATRGFTQKNIDELQYKLYKLLKLEDRK